MDLMNSNHTTQLKMVSFHENYIFTTVTKDPNYVTGWISETTANTNGHRLLIGLDVEWRHFFKGEDENPVAVLQLCVGHRCLIFQILHSPEIPWSLIDFLNNPNYTFLGVGVHGDVEKLVRHYGLGCDQRLGANLVDLAQLAAQMYGLNTYGLGLKKLARMLLGIELKKPKRVTLSRWDNEWLSGEQMDYATIDAFLSFGMGRVLILGF